MQLIDFSKVATNQPFKDGSENSHDYDKTEYVDNNGKR